MPVIAVSIPKGGVGKSTITCLYAEWLLQQGKSVEIIDADPNETTKEWMSYCAEAGRQVSTPNAEYRIVDTAGREGSSHQIILEADAVLAPFQALQADMSRLVAWFLTQHPRIQKKVGFIPNRLRALGAREQASAIEQVRRLINEEGTGVLFPGLIDRIAIYSTIFDGSETNFFSQDSKINSSLAKAHLESAALFSSITKHYGFKL